MNTTYAFASHTDVRFVRALWPGLFLQYVRDVAGIEVYLWNSLNIPVMIQYTSPQVKVIEIVSSRSILQSSLGGTPSNNPWGSGSESAYGFGDDDE